MLDDGSLYRALLVIFGIFAVGAVIMGSVGLYVVLTGGTTDGDMGVDALDEFACEEFDADLEMARDPRYDVERTLFDGREIDSFEGGSSGDGHPITITMEGELLNASARRGDGTALPVERDGNRVVVETGSAPFRLWIDTITEETTVTRTRLDVCPPA